MKARVILALLLVLTVSAAVRASADWSVDLSNSEGPSGYFTIVARGTNTSGYNLHSCSAAITVSGGLTIVSDPVVRIGDVSNSGSVDVQFTVTGDSGSYRVNFEGFQSP